MKYLFLGIVINFFTWSGLSAQENGYSQPLVTVPFTFNNYHLVVPVWIEGHGPFNFLFDSGAGSTLLMQDVVDSLGLEIAASRKNVGVSGAHEVGAVKGVQVRLGELDLDDITILSTSIPFEELDKGGRVHGVIGYPVLTRFVVKIDHTHNRLEIYDKNTYRYTGNGSELPIWMYMRLPLVDASFTLYNGQEIKGVFMVDTGARADIIINSPTVVQHQMADQVGRYYTVRQRIGTSERRSKIRYGRLRSLQLGSYMFEHIPVALSSDNRGVLSLSDFDGILGNRLLSRFNLIFDYERARLYLEPSSRIGNAYEINSSGLLLTFKNGRPVIKEVIDGTAADKAGLKEGDLVVSINTRQTSDMTPEEIRKAFEGDDEWVEVVISRSGKLKYTRFKLKPLI